MRILVFSDSHTDVGICSSLIKKLPQADMIIHAGDHISDARKLEQIFPDIQFKYVAGNCDSPLMQQDLTFLSGGKKFFLSHGHRYCVKFDYDYHTLCEKALSEQADITIFGHTHVPYCQYHSKLLLLNPGSIKYGHTFGIIEIENGKTSADICNADLWL